MLIAWMAYATALTVALVAGGLAAEGVARVWCAPRRFAWLIVLAIAVLAPPMLALRPVAPHASSPVAVLPAPAPASDTRAMPRAAPVRPLAAPVDIAAPAAPAETPTLQRYAFAAWIVASMSLLVVFAFAALRLRLSSRSWRETVVDDVPVLITRDVGPAVVGTLRPRIVLPDWTLALEHTKRALMLRHELEHIRARDPLFLRLATFAIVLFPWNAALWFIVRRLRQSVEIDCDRRVLRASMDEGAPREYGVLLLLVGARRSARLTIATGFAGYPPFLERRIKAMTPIRASRPALASAALIAIVLASTIAATRAPLPSSLRPVKQAKLPAPVTRSRITPAARPLPATTAPLTMASIAPPRKKPRHPDPDPDPARSEREGEGEGPLDAEEGSSPVVSPDTLHPSAPQAPATSRLATGRVLDSASNAPLTNVYVQVIGVQALGEPNWACSDARGMFEMKVPTGEAWLSAESADRVFARVILSPTDSVAVLRGVHATQPPLARLTTPNQIVSIGVRVLGPATNEPIIIVDGVRQPPANDSVHLTLRTAGGQVFEQDWNRRSAAPRFFIDGVELAWNSVVPGFVNPCVK